MEKLTITLPFSTPIRISPSTPLWKSGKVLSLPFFSYFIRRNKYASTYPRPSSNWHYMCNGLCGTSTPSSTTSFYSNLSSVGSSNYGNCDHWQPQVIYLPSLIIILKQRTTITSETTLQSESTEATLSPTPWWTKTKMQPNQPSLSPTSAHNTPLSTSKLGINSNAWSENTWKKKSTTRMSGSSSELTEK